MLACDAGDRSAGLQSLLHQRQLECSTMPAVMLRIGKGNDRSIHYVHDVNRGHNLDVSHRPNHLPGRSPRPDGAQMTLTHKTHRPVQFEIIEQTRQSVAVWIDKAHLASGQYLFPSRVAKSPHLSTRQYARILARWVESIGLDASAYGTHTMRRTKATLIYRRTKNLRAVQLLLGHTKLETTVRYLGIEVDDALEIAEQTEV